MTTENSPSSNCRNCSHAIPENEQFCGACGQRNKGTENSLWSLVAEFFVQQFAIEGRLFRSLTTLFLHPGQITLDYWEGRRARYLSPIQIYLIASVLFFLLIDLSSSFSTNSPLKVEAPDWERLLPSEDIRLTFGYRSYQLTKEQFRDFLTTEPKDLEAFLIETDSS